MKTYLVGGAVRDKLLGSVVSEKDWVVVGSTPQIMLDKGFRQVGRDFPVFLHPVTGEEYALARTERKTGTGYTGFVCFAEKTVTLEEDLKRRDLTINAMAMDSSGEIIDPFNGQDDLNNKIIRHVSDSFSEDPLRILRLARFAAKLYPHGFRVADETKKLLLSMVGNGELKDLTAARVWQELHKVLHEDRPDIFFIVLQHCGALEILFKEINDLFSIPVIDQKKPEFNFGVHMLMSLRKAVEFTQDIQVRFAVICNNFDKLLTSKEESLNDQERGHPGVKKVLEFCRKHGVPNAFRDLAMIFAREHIVVHGIFELTAKQRLKFLESVDAFRREDRLEQVLIACLADYVGDSRNHEPQEYPQQILWKQCFTAAKNVDIQKIIEDGYTKKDLGEQIRVQRVANIETWMQSLS